jgi:esterase
LGAEQVTAGLAVTRYGQQGPVIVFLHGLFGQGRNWTTIGKALSGQARVLLPDLPNHGRSEWTDHISYPEMASAVIQTVGEIWPDQPVTLVGHSMGGKVAMMMALQQPERVERLCVVDIAPVTYQGLRNFGDYVRGMRHLDLSHLTERAEADRQLQPDVPDPVVRSFLLQNLRRGPATHRPGQADARWHWQMNLELLGAHLQDLGGWPETPHPPYPGPVLWLAGATSDYVRPEFVPIMRSLFPRAQLMKIKDAGHWVHADKPEVFEAAIRRFTRVT